MYYEHSMRQAAEEQVAMLQVRPFLLCFSHLKMESSSSVTQLPVPTPSRSSLIDPLLNTSRATQMALVQPPGWALTIKGLPFLTRAATVIQKRVRGRQARKAFMKWCGDVVERAEALHEPILPPKRMEARPALPLHLQKPLPKKQREPSPYAHPGGNGSADADADPGGPEADMYYGVQPRLARRLAVRGCSSFFGPRAPSVCVCV